MKKTLAFSIFCAFGACLPSALAEPAAAEASAATKVSAYVVSFSGGG